MIVNATTNWKQKGKFIASRFYLTLLFKSYILTSKNNLKSKLNFLLIIGHPRSLFSVSMVTVMLTVLRSSTRMGEFLVSSVFLLLKVRIKLGLIY